MELKNIFQALARFFEQHKMDYAVIGAFALYAFGYERATKDIDFITRLEHQKKVLLYLSSLGFEATAQSDAFSPDYA